MKKVIIYLLMVVCMSWFVYAELWVFDFNNCPTSWEGTDCLVGGERVCGYDTAETPNLRCSAPGAISIPAGNTSTYSDDYNSSLDGGRIINCTGYDSGAPYCDNEEDFWCERNESCHGSSVFRDTVCLGSTSGGDFGISVCGVCKTEGTDQFDCYNDTKCESTASSKCNLTQSSGNNNYDTGTCNTGVEGSPSATCVCKTNYFICDGVENDADGCEWHAGDACFSSTGTIQDDECFSAGQGNCTRISDFVDCDDDDSDSNNLTCNAGNGCEVNPGTTNCDPGDAGKNNNFASCSTCQCDNNWLNCTSPINGTPGCEINEGAACLNSSDTGVGGTYEVGECFFIVSNVGGNCTSSGTFQDCDDSDGDGNLLTCNVGNGCEIDTSGSCSVGSLAGNYNGDCTCDVDTQHHFTNQSAGGSSDHANLWTDQYGSSTDSWIFNGSQQNFGTQIYFDHLANIVTTGNATLQGGFICDLIACYNITILNATGGGGGGGGNCSADDSCTNITYVSNATAYYISIANTSWITDNQFPNESTRFNALVGTDCGTQIMTGVNATGGVVCTATGSGGDDFFNLANDYITNTTTSGINTTSLELSDGANVTGTLLMVGMSEIHLEDDTNKILISGSILTIDGNLGFQFSRQGSSLGSFTSAGLTVGGAGGPATMKFNDANDMWFRWISSGRYLNISDDLFMYNTENIFFMDMTTNISSPVNGTMVLDADVQVKILAAVNVTTNITAPLACYDAACSSFDNATGRYWNSGAAYIIWNGSTLIAQG